MRGTTTVDVLPPKVSLNVETAAGLLSVRLNTSDCPVVMFAGLFGDTVQFTSCAGIGSGTTKHAY